MDWINIRDSKNKKNNDSKNSNMNDNNTKKKKKRFLTCFRPDSMEGFLFSKILLPPFTLVKKEEQEKGGGGGRKKHRNARLSRILKAIFTGTFLAKKVSKRKSIQNSFKSETNIATKPTVKTDSMKQEDNKLGIESNIINSTPLPKQWQDKHTNIVEENEEERCGSLSKQIRQDKDNNIVEENSTNGEGRYGRIIALCLPLIISVLGSIYWNKALSFFCTATGFFLIRWSSRYILPKHRLKLKVWTRMNSAR